MFLGEIYLSVEDLMKLMGTYSRTYAFKKHRTIRNEVRPGKESLLIREYCEISGDNYREVYFFLRGKAPPIDP